MYSIILEVLIYFMLCNFAESGYYSTCEIEGITDYDWGNFYFESAINDSHRGHIAEFKTKNILRMKVDRTDGYLNATWQNQTLSFYLSDNFNNYEYESSHSSRKPTITIVLSFECTEDTDDMMKFIQEITDVNNHEPVFSKNKYEYSFNMTIPKNFLLSDILPIKAIDHDITNTKISFAIEDNEYVRFKNSGRQTTSKKDEFSVDLVTLKDIEAPFNQEYKLTVTDDGNPTKSSNAVIKIIVNPPGNIKTATNEFKIKNAAASHPPVFEKCLYSAVYRPDEELKMEEPVTITYRHSKTTKLRQIGYEEYFKLRFEDESQQKIVVENILRLPNTTFEVSSFVIIEIEAVNEGLEYIPGRTALLIKPKNLENGGIKDCHQIFIFGYSMNYAVPLILLFTSMFAIVFINVYLIIMFSNKNNIMKR